MFNSIVFTTEKKVAFDSPDHINPWGTSRDSSRNHIFNRKIYRLFQHMTSSLKVLDLGCSGGGFVRDCINDGCFAIGLEGSDFSQKRKRAEWAIIPEFLFTCDVTSPFDISLKGDDGKLDRVKFNIVTSWELIEHIKEEDLEALTNNVKNHFADGAMWIMSISEEDDIINGVNLHQTVKPKQWWIDKFNSFGLYHSVEMEDYFNEQYIRGKKYNAPNSFHLILTNDRTKLPNIPKMSLLRKAYDFWMGSKLQRSVKRLIVG